MIIVLFLLLLIIGGFIAYKATLIVPDDKVMILEHDDIVYKVMFPGTNFYNPLKYNVKQIQWSHYIINEKGYAHPQKTTITTLPLYEVSENFALAFVSDENYKIKIDMKIFFKISNHIDFAYKTPDGPEFMMKLAQNILIDTLGKASNSINVGEEEIQRHLFYTLERTLPQIGVKITKIEDFKMQEMT